MEAIKGIKICDLREKTEEEWLEIRRSYIGASDIAAIAGENPWTSAITIYLQKTEGFYEDLSENEHVEFGKEMEDKIRDWFARKFSKVEGIPIQVREYPFMLRHPENEIFACNPDGIVFFPAGYSKVDEATGELIEIQPGKVGNIEIKTASMTQWREWQDDEVPSMYYLQTQHQHYVMGLDYTFLVALVGKRLLWKYIPRNEAVIKSLVAIGENFWNENVLKKQPPAPEGIDDAKKALLHMYGQEDRGEAVNLSDMQADYDRYKELKKLHKELDQDIKAIAQKFMARMGTAETAYIGSKKATWKTINRSGYEVKPTSFRQFRLY